MPTLNPASTWAEPVGGFLLHYRATRSANTVIFYGSQLRTLAAWADTSKWLDGARYGNLLVPDAGRLRELPARIAARLLPRRPDLAGCATWDRPRRCAFNAAALAGLSGG